MNLQDETKKVIANFISKGWPFTSLDISNIIKKEDDGGTVRHRDVAPVVRQLFATGLIIQNGYEQELIDVTLPSGDKRKAYLYHHWSTDTSAYTNRCQEPIVPKSLRKKDDDVTSGDIRILKSAINMAKSDPLGSVMTKVTPVTVVPIVAPNPLSDDQLRRAQKYDHRLEVPASWVGQVGLTGTIYAIKESSKLTLKNASDVDASDDVVGTMVVNNDGRLRVTKRVLDRVFTSSASGNELIVSKDQDTIVVEED